MTLLWRAGTDTIRRLRWCDWFVAIGQQLAANLSFHNWALSQAWSNNQYLHGCNLLLTWRNGWDQDRQIPEWNWLEKIQYSPCFNHVINTFCIRMRIEGWWWRNWIYHTRNTIICVWCFCALMWWRTGRGEVKATGILLAESRSPP